MSGVVRCAFAVNDIIKPIAVIDPGQWMVVCIWRIEVKVTTFLSTSLAFALCLATLTAIANDQRCATTRDGRVVCPEPDSMCVNDRQGEVICSTPGGGIEFDLFGEPACGPGYCTKNQRGNIFCSSAPRGAASTDRYGNAECSVSCVPGKPEACIKLTPSK
jgi:hypothetical protein